MSGGETEGQLVSSGSVVLDSAGSGVITFDPASARQRWEVKAVRVSSNQAATATTVPVATMARNTTIASQLSQGNNFGASWSGNQDVFTGQMDIGPADFLSVIFAPPPGATAAQVAALAGVTCYATVTGTRYTRRT